MGRIVILGCSFAAGSYSLGRDGHPPELLDDARGWYHFIPQLQGHEVIVYSLGGSGYVNYAHIIRTLHQSGQLDSVDHVMIAETYEPRWSLMLRGATGSLTRVQHNQIDVELWRYTPEEYMVMSWYPDTLQCILRDRYGLGVNDDPLRFITDVSKSVSIPSFVEMSHEYIRNLLRGRGIPITTLGFNNAVMWPDSPQVVCLMDCIYDKILLSDPSRFLTSLANPSNRWPHQTLEGNMAIGAQLGQLLGDRI